MDATQFELVVLNLAINARDAMPEGGRLTIETANTRRDRQIDRARAGAPGAGNFVAVRVVDTGSGMTEEVLAKAFEPFFTTKDTGKGSGLGLAQVLGFAEQSGGGVEINSVPGAGTTVTVYLPRAAVAEVALAAEPNTSHGRAIGERRARILLVDDDRSVRDVTVAMLEDDGYVVVSAGSGGAALELLAAANDIDLLVLDFAMPGMNGAELAREVRKSRAGLPIVFVTGYADAGALQEISGERIVQKPFRNGELGAKIRDALGAA